MVKAQEWLNKNYPLRERSEIVSLDISGKNLEGSLKLEGFVNLKEIDCSFNKLTDLQTTDNPKLEEIACQYQYGQLKELNLQNLPNLKILICNDNDLTSLDLSKNKNLKRLNVMDNNFSRQNLSFLKDLVNLEELRLGNWNAEKIKKNEYNRLWDSLENLKDMNKLVRLDIRNTDISSGLEYLPDSVVYFSCATDLRSDAKIREIFDMLDKQGKVELMDDGELINSGFIKDFSAKLRAYKEKSEKKEQNIQKKDEICAGLDEIIEQAKKAVSITDLTTSISSLNFFRSSRIERFKKAYEQKKQEVDQLHDLLTAKLKANQDIERTLVEGYEISEEKEGYAEKIKNLADRQAVEDFAKEMIDYLGKQKEAHQLLKDTLKEAEKKLSGKEASFEEIRKVREDLDSLAENNSPEAKQAYQAMNKDNEVTNYIKKLADRLRSYLEKKSKEKIDNPLNEPFVQEVKNRLRNNKEKIKLYWTLEGIYDEFSKARLEGKGIAFYPYTTMVKTYGHTNWKEVGEKFELYLDFGWEELQIILTFAHEISHNSVMIDEIKGLFPSLQHHSLPFWKSLNELNLIYVMSCLPPEKRQKLKNYLNPALYKEELNRGVNIDNFCVYLGNMDHNWENRARLKKYLGADEAEINNEWRFSWERAIELAEQSVKEERNWWNNYFSEVKKRPITAVVRWSEEEQKRKIYIYYEEKTLPSITSAFRDWEKIILSKDKAKKALPKISSRLQCGTCEETIQQEAKIVDIPFRGDGNK